MKSSLRKELRTVAEAVIHACRNIAENREYSSETLTAEIKTGCLTMGQQFEIEDYLRKLDEEIGENDFFVDEFYGVCKGGYSTYRAHYTKAVVPSPLVYSCDFADGFIYFEVTFEIVTTQHTELGSITLSSDSFQETLSCFNVLSEEEYEDYDDDY